MFPPINAQHVSQRATDAERPVHFRPRSTNRNNFSDPLSMGFPSHVSRRVQGVEETEGKIDGFRVNTDVFALFDQPCALGTQQSADGRDYISVDSEKSPYLERKEFKTLFLFFFVGIQFLPFKQKKIKHK